MLRSMLTHPDATERTRATLDEQIEQIAAAIPTSDAQLRAALIISMMLGITLGQQLLELDALRNAKPKEIAQLLQPTFRALTGEA